MDLDAAGHLRYLRPVSRFRADIAALDRATRAARNPERADSARACPSCGSREAGSAGGGSRDDGGRWSEPYRCRACGTSYSVTYGHGSPVVRATSARNPDMEDIVEVGRARRALAKRLASAEPDAPGAFTGKGWPAQEAWRKAAMRADQILVSPARAAEIFADADAQARANAGGRLTPYSDQYERVMRPGEYRYVVELWGRMPGNWSFDSTIQALRRGEIS